MSFFVLLVITWYADATHADVSLTVTAPQGVLVGQQAIISCVIDPDQQAAVSWSKGGSFDASTAVLVHGEGPITDGRYNEYSDRDIEIEGRASLRIQNTRLSDRGKFFCEVTVLIAGTPTMVGPESVVFSVAGPPDPPTISPPGTPSTESPLTLTCTTARGYPPATISWYRGQENRTAEAEQQTDVEQADGSVTSSRQYIFTPTKDDTGVSYRCVVSQAVLQSNLEAQTTFNVRYPAEISPTPPATTTVIAGQSASFSCPAYGNPDTFTYTWKEGGRNISTDNEDQFSQNGGVLTISTVRREQHDTVFSCDVTNNIGSADTASTTLDVQHAPDVSAPVTVTVEENHDLTTECTVTANPAVTNVEWKKQDSASPVSNSATLSITGIQRGAAGTYVCTARNTLHDDSIGTGTASTVVIVQYAPSKPTITIAPSPVVENQTVILTCLSASAVPDPTYTWTFTAQEQTEQDVNFGTTADNGGTLTITNVQRAQAGQYRCTATNDVGSTDSDLTELVVNFPPAGVSITPKPEEVELEDNITLECSVTAAIPAVQEYIWSKSVGSLPTSAQGATTNQLQITRLTTQDSGTYICTASNNVSPDGTAQYSLFVQYLDQPTITSNPGGSGQTSHTSTEGQSLSLECTAQAYPDATVVWTRPDGTTQEGSVLDLGQVNRTEAGTYNCTASNTIKGAQRVKHASIVINVKYPPSVVSFKAHPNAVDENNPVNLTCIVDSNPAPTSVSIVRVGTGSVGDVTLATGQGRTFSHIIQTVSYTDTGTYRCQASNGVGTNASRDLELLVNYIPKFVVGLRDKYAVAKGDPVTLTCNVTAYPTPVTFTWSKDGGSVLDTATVTNYSLGSTLSYTAVTESDYGFYNCTAMNIMGNRSTVIELAAESAPEPSTDLRVTMKNSSRFVTVEWTAGFNGGQETTHTVQYRTDAGNWENGPEKLEPKSEDHPLLSETFQLPEKRTYDIRVKADNDIEPAAESNVVNVTIEGAKTLYGSLPLTTETFSDELRDLQSTSAVQLTDRIISELDRVFDDIIGYETSTVTGYSEGSVVAAFQSVVGESESESAQTAFTRSLTDNQLGSWTVDSSKANIGETPPTVNGGGDNTLIIVIAVVCVVVVVAIVVVAVFVVRRRKSANDKKDLELRERITRDDRPSLNGISNPGLDMENSPDPAYAEVPSNGAVPMAGGNPYDDVHFEGDGTTAPVAGATAAPLDPNVQYATVNKNNNETPNPSTIYAQVDKDKKKKDKEKPTLVVDPSSEYATVDKSKKKKKDMPPPPEDPSAQYSEVKKDKKKGKKDMPPPPEDPSAQYSEVKKDKKKGKKDMPPTPEDPSAQYSEVKKDKKKDKKAPAPDVIYTEVVKDKKDKKEKKDKKKPTPGKKPAVAKKPTAKEEERLYDEVPKAEGAAAAITDENPYENPQESMPEKQKNPQGLIYAELSDFQVKPPPKKPSKPAPPKPRYEDEPTEYASINWNASRRRAKEREQSGSTTDDETPVTMI